jgi:ubiquinol-cytochrome c reductase subunit 7
MLYRTRADDLIIEENEVVLQALKRLPPKQLYDRVYRIRRATQLSITHKLLPKADWTKPEDDVPYLGPLIAQIEAEIKEREDLDTLTVLKSH